MGVHLARTRLLGLLLAATMTTSAASVAATLAAAPAHAAGVPALLPASASSIRVVPMDVTASDAMAAATYGLSVTNVDPSRPLKVVVSSVDHAAVAGDVLIQRTPPGGVPSSTGTWLSPPIQTTSEGASGTVVATAPTGSEIYYLGTRAPGGYVVIFYQEGELGNQTIFTQADDGFTSTLTSMLSMDMDHVTPTTTDDDSWGLGMATDPIPVGQSLAAGISVSGLSSEDVRGSAGGLGVLGAAFRGTNGLNGPLRVSFALGGQPVQGGPLTFRGVNGNGAAAQLVFDTTYGPAPAIGRVTGTAKLGSRYQTTGFADIGVPVTLTVPERADGGTKIRVSGTADPGARVDISARREGSSTPAVFVAAASVTASANGTWSVGTTMRQTTQFQATVNGKTPNDTSHSTVTVYAWLDRSATALGNGKVQFTVNGHPDVTGYVDVYYLGTRLAHVRTNGRGDAVFTVQSSAGRKTFDLYFTAPGCVRGHRSLTGTVR